MAAKEKIREFINSFGWPRLIIAGFLFLLFVIAPLGGVSITQSISDVLARFGQNSIMVLAMVPMIHSGCGLNFGLPVGIIAGLLGGTLSMQLGFTGPMSFLAAVLIATFFGVIFGWAYGVLLNKVKGGDRDLCGLCDRILHVHDVAPSSIQQSPDGMGV